MSRTDLFAALGGGWTLAVTYLLTRFSAEAHVFAIEGFLLLLCLITAVGMLWLGHQFREPVLRVTGYTAQFVLPVVWMFVVVAGSGTSVDLSTTSIVAFSAALGCYITYQGSLLDQELQTLEKLKRATESATESLRKAARSMTSLGPAKVRPVLTTDSGVYRNL